MQNANFKATLILEMRLNHYLAQLWACPGTSDHTYLKRLGKFVASMGLQPNTKTHTVVWRILYSDWSHYFRTMTQEKDFSGTWGFCRKSENDWYFPIQVKKVHMYGFDLCQNPLNPHFWGHFWDFFWPCWAYITFKMSKIRLRQVSYFMTTFTQKIRKKWWANSNISPANIYLFKFNNKDTSKRSEICSELTIKHQNDVVDVVLVILLLTLNIFRSFF